MQRGQRIKQWQVATWSDNNFFDGDSHDEEVANLCLMALEEPKVTSNFCDFNSYSFDELQNTFEELVIEFEIQKDDFKIE